MVSPHPSLRILHVVATDQRRGGEIFAADLVRQLNAQGVHQHIAVLRRSEGPGVTYDSPVTVLTPGTAHRLARDVQSLFALRRVIRAWKPHVIQAHGGEALKACVLAGTGRGLPVVYRRIGTAPPWLTTRTRRAFYRLLMMRAARIITLAETVRQETISLFRLPPDRVQKLVNAVDPRRLEPSHPRRAVRASLGIAPDAPVIASVAALTWEKDPQTHLAVSARVIRERPDVHHLIVGDGPLRGEVAQRAAEPDLAGHVHALGPRNDIADLLGASDLLLFASRVGGMEGMPGIAIEAGFASVPVVGYDVAGLGEVVVDGETGLLVRPGDVDALVRTVLELVDDVDRRRALGSAAAQRCRALFHIGAQASVYLEIYRALADGQGAVAANSG